MAGELSLESVIPTYLGVDIPLVGYGTYKVGASPASTTIKYVPDRSTVDVVMDALQAGYRMFDCAEYYINEEGIGEAIARSKIPRKELFIVSKVWNTTLYEGEAAIRKTVTATLKALRTDYIDLYLIHWPVVGKHVEGYKVLEKLHEEGILRSIGVANYTIEDYEDLKREMKIKPVLNQLEISPWCFRPKTLEYFKEEGIPLMSYRTLRQAQCLDDPTIVKLSKKYEVTPAQLLGRWCIQHCFAYIPKSTNPSRMRENLKLFHFKIEPADMMSMDSLTKAETLKEFKTKYADCVLRDTPMQGDTGRVPRSYTLE
mmetsp:Transcript_3118/g.7501  ORF Transcript_3118/g.7501 Transcript_3118/m.7501 type:complete len:314 (-) Transcript_3118:24-965(-)